MATRTASIVEAIPGVRLHRMERNGGKGCAVRAGIGLATGDFLIIQDADLEYDPNDYLPMLRVLLAGEADVVYGSRYLERGRYATQSIAAYLGVPLGTIKSRLHRARLGVAERLAPRFRSRWTAEPGAVPTAPRRPEVSPC